MPSAPRPSVDSAVLLFDEPEPPVSPLAPLAERMRPRTLDEVVGQRDITDPSGVAAGAKTGASAAPGRASQQPTKGKAARQTTSP